MGRCQKLDIILENKVIYKLMLSKNINNKKCAPKFVFFNEKKKSERFLHKNQHTQRKLLNFKNWTNGKPQYTHSLSIRHALIRNDPSNSSMKKIEKDSNDF